MPSKKQRRRREKLQRHEYEYVIETDEGEEIPIERPEPERREGKTSAKSSPRPVRGGREVPKPSLRRVARRTAIFAPLIIIIVWVFSDASVGTAARIINAVALIAFFIPFSYLVDMLMYRIYSRRQQRSSSA
ncbi:MAG TPA: hypothetical protein VHQ96_01615 [Gaiellaceae bacterium]|jgi:hypothetical protein|nr:hypothetical protein [Gaiellaceae bacterium]